MTTATEAFLGPERPKGENSVFLGPFWPLRWPWDGLDGSSGTQNTSLLGALGSPGGPDLGPNATWLVQLGGPHSYYVLGPLKRPLQHSWGPQKGPFWPREALLGALEVLGQPWGAGFGPNCHGLVQLDWTYGYHTL